RPRAVRTRFRARSDGFTRSDRSPLVSRVETLKKFIQSRPSDALPCYGLAQEYKNAGQFAEARAEFETLMRDHPDYTAAYLHAGNVLIALRERVDARAGVERCVQASPR